MTANHLRRRMPGRATAAVTVTTGVLLTVVVAGVASGAIPDAGTNVFHGCVNKATGVVRLVDPTLTGSLGHCITSAGVLQETAVTWNQSGPAGASGVQGPTGAPGATGAAGPVGATGPKGDTGAAGPQGPAGPVGTNGKDGANGRDGNTILSGSGAPADSLGNDGDFYLNTATEVLFGPKAGGSWPASGTSLVGSAGPPGPQGPAGPAGSGVGDISALNGATCTTWDGKPGTVTVTTTESAGSSNDSDISLSCANNNPVVACDHDAGAGLGATYNDCADPLATPGDPSTYNQTMAQDAFNAFGSLPFNVLSGGWPYGTPTPPSCPGEDVTIPDTVLTDPLSLTSSEEDLNPEDYLAYVWAYSGPNAGHVSVSQGITGTCPTADDPTWN